MKFGALPAKLTKKDLLPASQRISFSAIGETHSAFYTVVLLRRCWLAQVSTSFSFVKAVAKDVLRSETVTSERFFLIVEVHPSWTTLAGLTTGIHTKEERAD